ncbi:hypothetical protein BO71DRAFT_329506 [Aspergillus ellipticus CBS 707.79]|uniref:JmjC domain-containing protein n=1 Tax=Aspergillus ellipticus CBS 707.79 TaxID=1448320 RepID=A0A319D614_9EURO|nr:hypothetical protein BO71DRAFT_329506 [Aspergillus ellipticus CBS 707.79]
MDSSKHDTPSVQDLLRAGDPFVPFSEYPVQDIHFPHDEATGWIDNKLREGKPFVIRGFTRMKEWDRSILNNKSLGTLSSSGGRDVKMRLRDLLSQTYQARTNSPREFLYAKDLQCPEEWIAALEALLPSSLRHLGSLDLFRMLPKAVTPEVLMAYVGTRNSGFHRCFSGTVALNLLVESEGTGPGSICFGTHRNSQVQYDAFMEGLGKSSHTDWANVSIPQLKTANFPIYVTNQEPGDLVVFPSAAAHQVWNISSMVTKVVWNIVHYSSLASFFDYIQPVYQRQCHTDTGRVPLILLYALNRGSHNEEEEQVLLDLFRQLVEDEDIETETNVPIKHSDPQGAVVECNFCGLTIWNRHLHCEECGDFDLCLTCFISGRSCKHVADYAWTELLPRETCNKILQATRNRPPSPSRSRQKIAQYVNSLSFPFQDHHSISVQKTLGALAVAAADARKQSVPYNSQDKPARTRIKPIDPRGRIMGFVDNVFDQKRGKRGSMVAHSASPQSDLLSRGQKRLRTQIDGVDGMDPAQQRGTYNTMINPSVNDRRSLETSETHDPGTTQPQEPGFLPSLRSLERKGQLRIRDLVEEHRPTEGQDLPSQSRGRSPLPSLTPEDGAYRRSTGETSGTPATDEVSIIELEEKVRKLREYADRFLDLSLVDTHAKLVEKIAQLQQQIEEHKRRKAETLFDNLDQDFPDLASIAREEARRRGF